MIKVHIILDKYDWEIFAYFAVTKYDVEDIMERLWSIGCNGWQAEEAYKNLTKNKLNSGLTYSSYIKHQSVIVTALTDSPAQFFNSFLHEVVAHCVDHISDTLYINKRSEEYAYLIGDLGMSIFPHVQHLLCECCRKKKKRKRKLLK